MSSSSTTTTARLPTPAVKLFRHVDTATCCFVVHDPATKKGVVIDAVTDFDYASGALSYTHADGILSYVEEEKLDIEYVLETHPHADHLSGAKYLKPRLNAKIGIGKNITEIQERFSGVFNMSIPTDGSQFDVLFGEGDTFPIGELKCDVLATPGHTPACISYRIGDSIFVGDTLFHTDIGTSRCDFPGGSVNDMWDTTHRLLSLPEDTKVYVGHDYPGNRREFNPMQTVAEHKANNKMVNDTVERKQYVDMRAARDATLGAPRLLYPSLQVNISGGDLPAPENNGRSYVKVPLKVPTPTS